MCIFFFNFNKKMAILTTGDTGFNSQSIASFVKAITSDKRVGDDKENGLFGSTGASLQIQQSDSAVHSPDLS